MIIIIKRCHNFLRQPNTLVLMLRFKAILTVARCGYEREILGRAAADHDFPFAARTSDTPQNALLL
jgi:hypothetical protein